MINSFEELKLVSQDLYCIVYRGIADGISRICYLQYNNRPLFFYSYDQAKTYFDVNEISTCNDSLLFWRTGKLNFPDAKIVKVTLSSFEVVLE